MTIDFIDTLLDHAQSLLDWDTQVLTSDQKRKALLIAETLVQLAQEAEQQEQQQQATA